MHDGPTQRQPSRPVTRLILAAVCGSVIALIATGLFLDISFAVGGYTQEALVELPLPTVVLLIALGAVAAVVAVALAGRFQLPDWLRGGALGSLACVAVVVMVSQTVAPILGGSSGKLQAPYEHVGLVYGVPVGIVIGGVAGVFVSRRGRA